MASSRLFEPKSDEDYSGKAPDEESSSQGSTEELDFGAASIPETILLRDAVTEPRLALVIGNSRYKWATAIDNPVRDVRLIAWALEGLGFAVSRVENAGLAQMQDAVLTFGDALEAAGSEAIAFLYFAGHGIQQGGANFLIPVDAQLPSPRYLSAKAMSLEAVVTEMARSQRKATVIVLDACRNALPDLDDETGGPTEGLVRTRLPRPGQLVYSTAAQAVSSDGAHENSPFAEALAAELSSLLTPGRRIQDVMDDVAAKVSLATNGQQTVAVYREGVLLPLALTADDETRLRDWSKRPPHRLSRRQFVLRTMTGVIVLAAVAAAGSWFGAYPETRTTWMLRAGLLDRSAYDFACQPPWDGQADRYGLTRRDWCLAFDDSALVEKVVVDKWASEVAPGFEQGDPKALYLRMLQAALSARTLTGTERIRRVAVAQDLAARVSLTDLPRGGIAPYIVGGDPLLADRSRASLRKEVEAARQGGVLLATLLIAVMDNDQRLAGLELTAEAASDAIETALQRLEESDPSGRIADLASRIFSGRDNPWLDLASPERERFWLRRAAFAGYAPAAADLLDRSRLDPAYLLTDSERDHLSALVTAKDDPRGLYWRARSRVAIGEPANDVEMIALMTRAAEGGYRPAITDLIALYLSDRGGRGPDFEQALHWLERGRDLGDAEAIGRLGTVLARGRLATDGRVLLPARPDEARKLLERPEVAADPRAMLTLAELLRYGPIAQRDQVRAEMLLKQVEARLPYPDVASAAREETRRIRIERVLALGMEASVGIALGRPDAPLTISLALAPSCRGCVSETDLRQIESLVSSDETRIVVLPIWDSDRSGDAEASLVAVCAAPKARFAVFSRLMERRDTWRDAVDAQTRRLAFQSAIDDLDGRPREVDACLADQGAKIALQRQRDFLVRSLDVRGSMTIFVGGDRLDFYLPDDLLAAVRAQLPASMAGKSAPGVRPSP